MRRPGPQWCSFSPAPCHVCTRVAQVMDWHVRSQLVCHFPEAHPDGSSWHYCTCMHTDQRACISPACKCLALWQGISAWTYMEDNCVFKTGKKTLMHQNQHRHKIVVNLLPQAPDATPGTCGQAGNNLLHQLTRFSLSSSQQRAARYTSTISSQNSLRNAQQVTRKPCSRRHVSSFRISLVL